MGNIILTGMPGAGKSTVGVVLAKRMGYHFVDTDLVLQEKTGRLLWQIIEEKGVEGFLKAENDINASLCVEQAVIATGGSAVYGREAMEHLKRSGRVVYLKLPLSSVAQRLGSLEERGVVRRTGETLEELYQERAPYYEKYADITLECEGKMIKDIAAEIVAAVKKWEKL